MIDKLITLSVFVNQYMIQKVKSPDPFSQMSNSNKSGTYLDTQLNLKTLIFFPLKGYS